MRKTTGMMIALAAMMQTGVAAAQFGPPPPPPPAPRTMPDGAATPTTKWLANFADNSCEMVRDFGADTKLTELLLRPLTGTDQIQIEYRYNGNAPRQAGGSARLAMYPGTATAVGSYFDVPLPAGQPFARTTMLTMPRKELSELSQAQVIAIVYPQKMIALQPGALNSVVTVLKECEDDLIKSWGHDPKVMGSLKNPPIPLSPEKWYTAKDLPTKQEAKEVRPTNVRFTVGADGGVTDCAIVSTSGSQMYDDKACALITSKAKYKPALNASGQPVPALIVMPVVRPFTF